MKGLWQILALILLALMVPASMCCLMPQLMENRDSGCCSNGDESHDYPPQPEACPSTTIAHSRLPAPVPMPEMQMVELVDLLQALRLRELTAQAAAPVPYPATAPPELPTMWAFVSRAALPARAPSALA